MNCSTSSLPTKWNPAWELLLRESSAHEGRSAGTPVLPWRALQWEAGAQPETQETPFQHQKCLFHCEGSQTLTQAAHSDCAVSILGIFIGLPLCMTLLEQVGWTV